MKNVDFQALFESAPGLYLILLSDFTIVAASDNYLKATMTQRDDILGRGLFDVFPDNPDDTSADGVSKLKSSLQTVLKKKIPHAMQVQKYDIRRPDGSFEERYWSPLNTPVFNDNKELIYIIHLVEDVTEKIKIEKRFDELNKREEKLRSINGNTPDLMTTIDRNGIITYTNRVLEGHTIEDVIGKKVINFIPIQSQKTYKANLANAFKGIPQEFEILAYGKNNEPAWYSVRMAAEYSDHSINSVLVISTDITLRREAIIREEVINNISNELNFDQSVNQFVNKIRLQLRKVFNTDNFYVSIYNKETDELTFIFQYIDDEPDPSIPHSRVAGNGLSEYIIRTKKGLLMHGDQIVDFQTSKGIFIHMDHTKSWLGVPIMFEKEVLGAVAVLSFIDGFAFKEKDKELLNFVGSQIGAFIARKEAQAKLRDSQVKWDSLVKNSGDIILTISKDRKVSYISKLPDNFNEKGYGFEDIVGKKFETLVSLSSMDSVNREVGISMKTKATRSFIMVGGLTGNYYNCTTTPLIQEGKMQGLIVIMKNVNDLFQAQQKIIESEEKYRSVVQDQTEYIVRWKPDGEIIFANKSYLEFNESSTKELYNKNYHTLIPATERKRFDKKIRSLTPENPVQIDSHQASRGKIGNFWHEWVDRAFFDENNKVIEYQSVGRDITQQKKAELEIRKSEEFKQSILSALASSIAVINSEGTIISANDRWNEFAKNNDGNLALTGIGANYIKVCQDSIKNGDAMASKALHGIKEILSGVSNLFELEYPCDSKKESRWFLMRATPFKGDSGGAVIVHYDISEQKLKEVELKNYKDNLEKLVETRTSKLNEVNLELEAFNYSVSHDLRTPIRAIDIYTGLLAQELKQTELFQYVKQIDKCTAEMNELIKALMEFSKMNKAPISIEKIHLNAFVYHAFEKQKIFENAPNAILKMDAMPVVLADNNLLTIVFNNLLSNAIKYSAQRKKPIIEVGYSETDEKYIIYIKDNGVGFNSKLTEKLFKPFSRLHHGEEYKGTGAGLAIVERIIRRHNGTIYAESEVDQGAVFYFTLPKKFQHITK